MPRPADQNDKATEAILTAEARWAQAHVGMDLGEIDSILSSGYRQLAADGSITTREQLLASYASGERNWQIAQSTDHVVEILNDVAIVIGIWQGKGVNRGQPFDYRARFLAVYRREDGDWKLHRDVSVALSDQPVSQ